MHSSYAALVLGLLLMASAAFASETAGVIKTAVPAAWIIRDGNTIPAEPGAKLTGGDIVKTEKGGRLGIILRDDSLLSVGADTEIHLKDFAFAPAAGKMEIILRLVKGMAAYVSGQIGKLAPDRIRFETPVATIGIRGTRFIAVVEE